MKKTETKQLDKQLSVGGQNVDLTIVESVRFEDERTHVLRYDLRSNAYKMQGHARSHRWDGKQWQTVHTIHAHGMETPEGLYAKSGRGHHDELEVRFAADLAKLRDVTKSILSLQGEI